MDISEAQLKLNEAVAQWAESYRHGTINGEPAYYGASVLALMSAWEDFKDAAKGLGAEIRKEE